MKNKVLCHRHCISHTNTSSMVCTVVCRWYTLALECMRSSVRWTQTNCWYILCIYNDCWYIFKGQLSKSEYGVTDWLVLYTSLAACKHYYSIYLQYSAYTAYYSIQPYCSIPQHTLLLQANAWIVSVFYTLSNLVTFVLCCRVFPHNKLLCDVTEVNILF